MIAIIDYGVGNLFSLKSSLAAIGREAVVTGDRAVLRAASHVILPGVGAFGDAAARSRRQARPGHLPGDAAPPGALL